MNGGKHPPKYYWSGIKIWNSISKQQEYLFEDYKLINAKTLLCKKKTNLQNALLFFDIYKLQRVFGLGRNFFEYAGGGGGKS